MTQWDRSVSSPRIALVWQIALGVFIGNLAALFVAWRFMIWSAEIAVAEAAAELKQSKAAIANQHRKAAEERARLDLDKRAEALAEQRAAEVSKQRAQQEAARREAAWQKFYRKPAACDDQRGGAWTVDCANEFMRAKKKFDDLYDEGKL